MLIHYNLPANIQSLYSLSFQTPIREIGGPTVVINLVVIACAFIYRFGRDWMFHERLKRELIEAQLGTELKLLKSQIHPHFLFNTLNNIYGIARANNDEDASAAISKLSGLLRFMLYENDKDTIPLTREIEYIHNLIDIQQLRQAEGEMIINFEIKGDITCVNIAPMILIPFVENAFKYGVDIMNPSIINIQLEIENKTLLFEITNPKSISYDSGQHGSGGLGISNVERRLITNLQG